MNDENETRLLEAANSPPKKPKSKHARWEDAVKEARLALDAMRSAIEERGESLRSAFQDLEDVRSEYEEVFDAMSERTQEGERGERFRVIVHDLSPDDGPGAIENIVTELDSIEELVTAIEEAELP